MVQRDREHRLLQEMKGWQLSGSGSHAALQPTMGCRRGPAASLVLSEIKNCCACTGSSSLGSSVRENYWIGQREGEKAGRASLKRCAGLLVGLLAREKIPGTWPGFYTAWNGQWLQTGQPGLLRSLPGLSAGRSRDGAVPFALTFLSVPTTIFIVPLGHLLMPELEYKPGFPWM